MADKLKTDSAIFLIAGDDEYLIDSKAREMVNALCPEAEQALGLEVIDGGVDVAEEACAALAKTMDAVLTVGFFGGRKVVWLRKASFFSDSQVGKAKDVKERVGYLTDLIKKGLPEGHQLLISAIKVDGRSAFYKACKAHAELIEFKVPEKTGQADQSAIDLTAQYWREIGLKPDGRGVLEQFVALVGADTRTLRQESDKLSSYLGPERREARESDLTEVVCASRESITWDLADQVGRREWGGALRTLRQLLFQKESPIGLIFGLENRFRELAFLRECMRRKWLILEQRGRYANAVWQLDAEGEEALSLCAKDPRKTHPFRLVKLVEQAQKYSLRELLEGQQLLASTHEQMVSSSIPQALLLEFAILRLSAPADAKKRAS